MSGELKDWFRVILPVPDLNETPNSEEEWREFVVDVKNDLSCALQNISQEESVPMAKVRSFFLGLLTVLKLCPIPSFYLPSLRFEINVLASSCKNIRIMPPLHSKSGFPGGTIGEIIEVVLELMEEQK